LPLAAAAFRCRRAYLRYAAALSPLPLLPRFAPAADIFAYADVFLRRCALRHFASADFSAAASLPRRRHAAISPFRRRAMPYAAAMSC
jgi:hypothetical protein